MEKSKLGLPVPVLGALTFLLFLFSGYTAGLLLAGYILLREENVELRKTAVTAVLTAVAISAVNLVIGLLPDVVDIFESLFNIFGEYLGFSFFDSVANFLYSILTVLKTVVFTGLAVLALLNKPLKLGFIDKLMD